MKHSLKETVASRKYHLSLQVSDHSQRDQFAGLNGGIPVGFQSPIAGQSVNGLVLSAILLFLRGVKEILENPVLK